MGNEQQKVFKHYITWGKKSSWTKIEKHSDDKERELLQVAWLQFSGDIVDVPQEWLNSNFQFIESHFEDLGLERCMALCTQGVFEEISSTYKQLMDCIIEHNAYTISIHNLSVIVSYFTRQSVDADSLNYSWCLKTNNTKFIEYINSNLEDSLNLFSGNAKNENANGILSLVNSKDITPTLKTEYLSGQENRLADYTDICKEVLGLATELFLIEPTWDNVMWVFHQENELTVELSSYIQHFTSELSRAETVKTEDMQPVFENIVLCPDITDATLSQL